MSYARQRDSGAHLFFPFRSVVPIGIVSKARTTCCQVCMYRVGAWTPCFSRAVVSRSTNLPRPFVSQQECAHGAFLCSFAWDGMLVFDLVSLFVFPARCHNHNTSSVSQVVDILWLLRDVGGGDLPIKTCQCHLLLFLTRNVFCVKDVVAPWCATCYVVSWCVALSECVVFTCRVVRGRLFRARNNTVWFTCH